VVIEDDHEIIRQGLDTLDAEEPEMKLLSGAANGQEAVELANRL